MAWTVEDLGLVDYDEAYTKQRQCIEYILNGAQNYLLLCEHKPILTMGRMFQQANLFFSKEDLFKEGVQLKRIDRGGDITLHAPGQLVIYPIVQLMGAQRDLRWYLRQLERVVVGVLADFDLKAQGNDDQRGVWIHSDKIASMGIGVKKWVCFHGIGLNVNTDLSLFRFIRPCGLDVHMTSMQKVLGREVSMDLVKKSVVEHVAHVFDVDMAPIIKERG